MPSHHGPEWGGLGGALFSPWPRRQLLLHPRRAGLGAAGRHPWGWRRIQACRSTCLLLPAVQRRRVESLVLGAHSSSPVHRALVLALGTNIAVLLDCSKSSRQCSLPSLLTYLLIYQHSNGCYPTPLCLVFGYISYALAHRMRLSWQEASREGAVFLIFLCLPQVARVRWRAPASDAAHWR